MDKLYDSETGCCPRFNPAPWDEKELILQNRLFVKDHVKSFFHIPMNYGAVMTRNMEKIAKAGSLAAVPFMLSDEKSMWGADIYIEVSKDVPASQMVRLSGTFLTKVFEGPYKNIRTWINQMKDFVTSKNKEMKNLYFFYTTCPKCAKYYGKNYVVLVAQLS